MCEVFLLGVLGSVRVLGDCVWVVGLLLVLAVQLAWGKGAWLGAAGTVQLLGGDV